MDALMRWGISIILALQGEPRLVGVMQFFTFLGSEGFFLFVMPAMYWCVDATMGVRLAVVLIASNGLNGLFKIAFHLPRPYWVDLRVKALSSETSYGIPSGHAMNATTICGFVAAQVRKWWAWVAAIVLILMISLSRLYLGVHFPTDVLAGWILGIVVLWAFLALERRAVAWAKRLTMWQQIGLAFVLSLLCLALFIGVLAAIASSPDPITWEQNAALATSLEPGESAIAPRNPEAGVTFAGMVMGLGLALAFLAYRPTQFDARGPLAKRGLRFVIGLIGVVILWLGLKLIAPQEPFMLAVLIRYIRYTLVVFWALYLAPWVFVKMGL